MRGKDDDEHDSISMKHSGNLQSLPLLLLQIFWLLLPTPLLALLSRPSKPFQCANMQNIGYPFWGDNRPEYCGHPGFQLDCKGDAPEITIMSARFRVLGINNLLQILVVTRADYWNNICPTLLFNTTLNFTLFNYTSGTQNVTVYYDCPIVPFELPVKGLSNGFNCTVNNTNTLSYYVTRNVTNFPSLIRERLASCSDNVTVQVLHSEAVAMENDLTSASLTSALNGGFALLWVANDSLCYQCKGTGGQCGHNLSMNEFTCYCSDQPYARECQVTPDSVRYETCSEPFQCANIPNIGYPFWGHSRPEYCGYPGFELDCNGDAPEITVMSISYRVLDINKALQILNVARADYWNNICPTYFFNTTLNSTPFDYTPNTQNVTQYFCCPAKMFDLPVEGLSSYFDCSANNTIICSCYMTRDITDFSPTVRDLFESCSERVTIQVFRSEALADESNLTSADLAAALSGGFGLQWTANDTMCDQCKRTGGQCGYNNTLYEFICYCPNQSYARECPAAPESFFKRNEWIKIVIGIVAGVVGITVIIVICRKYLSYKAIAFWKKETKDDDKVKEFIRNHESLAPKPYKYSKVKKITNSFADELGKGGFGVVYKGRLSDGRLVAVKVLNQSKGNGEDFINEVASISRTSHVNVVSLLGFCHERTNRALIYEFMSYGSLDKCIYDQGRSNANRHLEWNILYQIAVGIGRGLEYLHRGCNTRILHFDIKPHNILLDENFCPKISDFGLAKLCQSGESTVSMQNGRGTPGYAAPELFRTNIGKVSYKSDVYSYGMMVLEMVGGRKNFDVGVAHSSEMYFPHWIHNHLEQGQDLRLGGVMTNEEEELARKMILVSLWCIQTLPSDRPSMTEVVEKLEGSLQSLEIPAKPYPSSPARPPQHSSASSSSSS